MTADVLDAMRRGESLVSAERFRVGDMELDGPNYRQVHRWAKQLNWTADQVLETICSSEGLLQTDALEIKTTIEGGVIKTLSLDLLRFEIKQFDLEPGLGVEKLKFWYGIPQWPREQALPSLRELEIPSYGFESVTLSVVPNLESLKCTYGPHHSRHLAHPMLLDLSVVPKLMSLECCSNGLSDLDLSTVPNLTRLRCDHNYLSELDLIAVPSLKSLRYAGNELSGVDLSLVPLLSSLDCGENGVAELDLSPISKLSDLFCRKNELRKLDLSSVPDLWSLDCGNNNLAELDLSPVPNLCSLYCNDNHLTELDLSSVPNLMILDCRGNKLNEIDVRRLKRPNVRISADSNVRIIRE